MSSVWIINVLLQLKFVPRDIFQRMRMYNHWIASLVSTVSDVLLLVTYSVNDYKTSYWNIKTNPSQTRTVIASQSYNDQFIAIKLFITLKLKKNRTIN